jgi:hypothetical protein
MLRIRSVSSLPTFSLFTRFSHLSLQIPRDFLEVIFDYRQWRLLLPLALLLLFLIDFGDDDDDDDDGDDRRL